MLQRQTVGIFAFARKKQRPYEGFERSSARHMWAGGAALSSAPGSEPLLVEAPAAIARRAPELQLPPSRANFHTSRDAGETFNYAAGVAL